MKASSFEENEDIAVAKALHYNPQDGVFESGLYVFARYLD